MHHGSALFVAASLLASSVSAAEPPLPAWHGVWQGSVGSAPVRACFDGDRAYQRGSYYYRSRMIPIPLTFEKSRWLEHADDDKTRATFQFDKVTATTIEGRWIGGGKTLGLALERVAIKPDADDQGPCGSQEYIAPRLGPTRVVESRGAIAGTPYRKLTLVAPPSFKSVGIESFALVGSSPAIRRINAALAKPLTSGTGGWIECMRGNLALAGNDGDYSEELTPTMIGNRYLSANHHNDGSCGGAHPYSDNVSRTFDLSSGAEIDLNDWLTPRAVKRERYDGTSDVSKTLTPAFRAFVLAGWKASEAECQSGFEQADFWDIGLARAGLGFTPSLAHVEQACTETITVPFARLQPWLSAAGKAGVAMK